MRIERRHWLLFSSIEATTAAAEDAADDVVRRTADDAAALAAYWAERLGCRVGVLNSGTSFAILQIENKSFFRVASVTDGQVGWIFVPSDAPWAPPLGTDCFSRLEEN